MGWQLRAGTWGRAAPVAALLAAAGGGAVLVEHGARGRPPTLWLLVAGGVAVVLAVASLVPVLNRLDADLLRLSEDLNHANLGVLIALGSAVAKRDRETNSHDYRVTFYAASLAEEIGLPAERIRGVIKGAFLHDVGKLGVVDAILRKPGPLTVEETAAMKTHVSHGVEIVSRFRWLHDALDVVQHHHERFDGSGYPAGLRGEDIPVAARMFAIVDAFDALTSRRPYKEPASLEVALGMLEESRGAAFDPVLLDRFAELAPALHRSVSGASDAELAGGLDEMLARYFAHEGGTHRRWSLPRAGADAPAAPVRPLAVARIRP